MAFEVNLMRSVLLLTELLWTSHAYELQSSLAEILAKLEKAKQDQEKLARNNTMLQDYIGGLTQSMSRTNLTSSSSSGRKK